MTPAEGDPSLKEAVARTWILVSYTSTAADGRKTENFGQHPLGIAHFDRAGHFVISVVRSDLAPFASNNREHGTADENAAVVRGSIAYFGTYAADAAGTSLIFEITGATLPNWIGATQTRGVRFETPNGLTLINAAASGGGVAEITWRRAD